MPLPEDLLEQAEFLAQRDPRRPRQASLRRSVSTAYYAVFHLLVADAAAQASPLTPSGLSDRVQRALEHGAMKEAAKRFESGNLPDHIRPLVSSPVPAALSGIAKSFVYLQEQRHRADYDMADRFAKARTLNCLAIANQLFADWEALRNTDDARVFLSAIMFWKIWSK